MCQGDSTRSWKPESVPKRIARMFAQLCGSYSKVEKQRPFTFFRFYIFSDGQLFHFGIDVLTIPTRPTVHLDVDTISADGQSFDVLVHPPVVEMVE